MARHEQLYAGQLSIDGAEPTFAEVWYSNGTAVAYLKPSNTIAEVLVEAVVDTDSGHLVLTGIARGTDELHRWEAFEPEKVKTRWRNADVMVDGVLHEDAMVIVSNHKATVTAKGREPVLVAGGSVRTLGGRAAVLEAPDGASYAMTLPKRGCGCGGRRK